MFCTKCGKEIKDGAAFCPYCGTATEKSGADDGTGIEKDDKTGSGVGNRKNAAWGNAGQSDKAQKKSHAGLYMAGILLAGFIGGIFLFRGIFGGNGDEAEDRLLADGTPAGSVGDENWQDLKPFYEAVEVPVIDIHSVNYTAGTKSPGIVWDSTLFYWLEDVDQESSEDGYLAKCSVGRMFFRSAEDDSLIQYEVYRHPESGEIYKIVSVEQRAEELHLTDYYYQDGNPNFTFSRNDSVYTPTYATPTKTGERYYFNGDVMARWRMIEEPRIIEEYVLTLNDANYSQYDYYEQSGEIQKSYDETESRELNAARNTLDAVTAAGTGVGLVEGRVINASGNPLAGMTVDIIREEDGTLLYRSETAEDGSFRSYVYLEDVLCKVIVRGNDIYASNSVEGVELSGATGGSSCGSLLLNRVDGEESPVHINVYDAVKVRTEEGGGLIRDLLQGAEVFLRTGVGVKTGEPIQTLTADEAGEIRTVLPAGTYTAQIDVPGYVSSYVTVEVAEKETEAEVYVLPTPGEGQTGIVLSWEGEADLDLTLFTPYQSTDGDMAHIGGKTAGDSYGNRLVADNTACCEVMYVNTGELGNYKLYVNNYTESEAENYSSDQLGGLHAHINIYDSTGLLEEFSFPAGESGVVWEVADLNGSRIMPAQRVYRNLAGKKWWTQDKRALDMEENARLRDLMEGMVLAAWGNNDHEPYGYNSDVVNSMQAWVDKLYQGSWENMGNWLGNAAPIPFYDQDYNYLGEQDSPYVLSPAEVEKILERREDKQEYFACVAILTKEMLENWAFAASGREWELQDIKDAVNMGIIGNEYWTEQIGDDYILIYGGDAGFIYWVYLENITTEYAGAGCWSVTAECFYECDLLGPDVPLQMANATFRVERNPESCFDGYSITGMDLTPIDNTDWAQAYYDYLTEGRLEEDFSYLDDAERNIDRITLCYINEDSIPELYVNVGVDYALYTYYDGQVIELLGGRGITNVKWLEKENLIMQRQGGGTIYADSVLIYEITNGKLHLMEKGDLVIKEFAEANGYPLATWNDIEVTEDEYYLLRKQAFDEERTGNDKHSYTIDSSYAGNGAVKDIVIDGLYQTIEHLNGKRGDF